MFSTILLADISKSKPSCLKTKPPDQRRHDEELTLRLTAPPSCRFVPSYLRLGSWNIVMFVSYEQIKRGMMKVHQSWQSPA